MSGRKSISKKLRFEVFKRDGFTCQYCGATPPSTVLHIDHISPVAKGGGNNIDNLVTSCDSCNLGKGAREFSSIPQSLMEKAAEIKEKEAQIKGYYELIESSQNRIESEAWLVAAAFEGVEYVETFNKSKFQSIKRFLGLLPYPFVLDAAEQANAKIRNQNQRFKYFCGICWNMIKRGSE